MSADLLDFDDFYKAPQNAASYQPSTATPVQNGLSFFDDTDSAGQSQQVPNAVLFPDSNQQRVDPWANFAAGKALSGQQSSAPNDVWGAFGSAGTPAKTPAASTASQSGPRWGDKPNGSNNTAQNVFPRVQRTNTVDLFSSNVMDMPGDHIVDKPPPRPQAKPQSSYGEVLFDAEDLEDDDDEFGDFETVSSPPPITPQTHTQSLDDMFGSIRLDQPTKRPLNLAPQSNALPYPQAPKSPSFQERNPFADLGLATAQFPQRRAASSPRTSSPQTAWPEYEEKLPKPGVQRQTTGLDDDWGDFADLPPETPAAESAVAESWDWDTVDQVKPAVSKEDVLPPSNIPPPSILLAMFPQLFDLPQTYLFKAVANQSFSLKNRIISDPSTVKFLRGYLLIAVVAAHVVAGRKLRWKRDTVLSQAMKIGPAAAGGKGGMKLTGIDRGEVVKENREAEETVRIWKDQLGRLKSAVAVANSSMQESDIHLIIPEIETVMQVKAQEGLKSAKPCVICGLKREERVAKVDVNVEDSFGEWWVDHWGHRTCRNFWQENESKLRHR